MQHRIRKQVMNLTINNRLNAFRTQHLAGPFYYRQLMPALEKIFNELSTENETISLDKLELDLGILPVHDLESPTWSSEIESLLRKQVSDALREQRKDANLQRVAIKQNICRQWLFYMSNGYLDWNSTRFDEKTLAQILEILATDYTLATELRRLVQKNKNARVRMVRSHSEKFLVTLVEILTATTQQELPQAITELGTLLLTLKPGSFTGSSLSKQLQQQVWVKIFGIVANEKPGLPTGMLVKAILMSEENLPSLTIGRLKQLTNLKTIYPVLKVVSVKQQVRDKQQQFETGEEEKSNQQKKPEQAFEEMDDLDEDGIFVSYAGIVLIHPFISSFFKKLELTAEGKFRNNECLEKGVNLLHYIATGKITSEEYELAVPKFLCGLPLHHALKEIIELTEAEKQEADNMLSAAIDQWEKLQRSSIEALRENFLQRPGKLYIKNDLRYLQVEGGSLDVLLDFLPWTLSIVKLPWMKELLRIEWR